MIENADCQNGPLPLGDIINMQLNKIYDEAQDNVLKKISFKQVQSYTDVLPKEIKSQTAEVEEFQREKTVRKTPGVYKPEFFSTKTINQNKETLPTEEEDNPEWDLFSTAPAEQTAHILRLQSQFSDITSFFLSLARKSISPGARVQLLFDQQSSETFNVAKLCDKMHKKAVRGKVVSQQSLNYVVEKLKREANRLKKIIHKNEEIDDLNTLERQLQTLCYHTTNMIPLFDQLHIKEYQVYRQKRESLLKKYPISELFRQLQIMEHYNQFRRLRSQKEIDFEEKIPYMPAVKELRKLARMTSSSAGYEAILVFRQKIRQCYNTYFKNTLRLADMDDYLPVTIFCVLAVDCDQNLLGVVKMLLIEVSTSQESEWQKKTLTDLQAAFEYIIKQWRITK